MMYRAVTALLCLAYGGHAVLLQGVALSVAQQLTSVSDTQDLDLHNETGYDSDPTFTHEESSVEKLAELAQYQIPLIKSVIVLGCSHGLGVQMLHSKSFDAYGVDAASEAIEEATKLRGNTCASPPCFKQASLTSLPFPEQQFDAGLSSDVLEHIDPHDVKRVVEEISRVVKYMLVLRIAVTEGSPYWAREFWRFGWKVKEDQSTPSYVQLVLERTQ
mmetsp:Transcript_17065/g.30800  ORF Transcript_17065/g.30800 Transcript_17065/m.30800 type:complete len:217 (-) Transcript_17065:52-702(-)